MGLQPSVREAGLAEPIYQQVASEWRVQDMPATIRPREMVERSGVEHVGNDVLLALLLRTGVKGVNVVDLARGLMRRYGTLGALAQASVEELSGINGISKVKAQILKASLELGRRLQEEQRPEKIKVKSPEDVYDLLGSRAAALEHEMFWVLLLDTKHALKCRPVDVTAGILNASLVHPREVFREAVRSSAAAVILAHNHPSGDPAPSAEDLRITRQLIEAGDIMDIKVLDHVILGHGQTNHSNYTSLRESGLVTF